MTIEEKIALNEQNIRQALKDYGKYTDSYVLGDVSEAFIKRLAVDSTYAKEGLRELFRRSPAWNEELDALVINGNRTHAPNAERIKSLIGVLMKPIVGTDMVPKFRDAVGFFYAPDLTDEDLARYAEAINAIAPNAYKPGRKKARIFRDICVACGCWDDKPGAFQKTYAQLADEFASEKIDFKLFVSLNPAHFITMSNPKRDSRGSTLTSCHSFNATNWTYNNGCTGYARDPYAMIAFTASDPDNPETLNNRKTTRQIFAYKPGNGLLLQSRMYNTSGGTTGAQAESKAYRVLVQRELAEAEDAANLWSTFKYVGNKRHIEIEVGLDFHGYPDWIYEDFNAMLSLRKDHEADYKQFALGVSGICIECAKVTSDGVRCWSCKETNHIRCACCGHEHRRDALIAVRNNSGDIEYICESCLRDYYTRCPICGEYHTTDSMTQLRDGRPICRDCRAAHASRCAVCRTWVIRSEAVRVRDSEGVHRYVCHNCETQTTDCMCCGETYLNSALFFNICPSCVSDGNNTVSA